MQKDFHQYVGDRVEVASTILASKARAVDITGRDRDDYRSILNLQVLEHFGDREKEYDVERQKYWANSVIRNKVTDCRRYVNRSNEAVNRFSDFTNIAVQNNQNTNTEDKYVQRDLLRRLHARLAASEWSLLMAYVEQGSFRDTWRVTGTTVSERAFVRRLRRLLDRCKIILQKSFE